GAGDDIARELDSLSSQADVEAELAALKAGKGPQAIEGAETGGAILQAEPEQESTEGNQP
ncbi:MAG TPA: PspA/IM30 family protein, partial [Nocardioides sp.]